MNEKILELVKQYLDGEARNNGTCISITVDSIKKSQNLENVIENFANSVCYKYNSARIKSDEYGVERLILFSI